MNKFLIILSFFISTLSQAEPKIVDVNIQLNWKAEPQFGGFYAAALSKADASEGLKFNLSAGGSGTPTAQLLLNEKVDFAIVSAEEILISNDKNPSNPLVALFATYQKNPQMIMCHQSLGIESLKKLFQSKSTLALQNGLSYAAFLKKKYPKSNLKFVPYIGGIGSFVNNQKLCQQGFINSEPLLALKAGVAPKTFLIADEGFNPYTTVLATRKAFYNKNQNLVKKVVTATRSGWLSYLENPVPTNALMVQLNPAMDLRTALESAQAQEKLIRPNPSFQLGTMSTARWSELIQQLKDLKIIQSKLDPKSQSIEL